MAEERPTDPATETSCRHCGELIRKRRDRSGNGFEWVAFLGYDPTLRKNILSRFCYQPGTRVRLKPSRQHAPIPIDNPKKLEKWLNS